MEILRSLFLLLLFQLMGDAIRAVTHAPVPGPVLGMVLLAAWFILRKREPDEALQQTAETMMRWMGLLFVPAGVGIFADLALLRAAWFPMSVALVGSTFLTLVVTAWLMQRLGRHSA